MCIFMKDDKSKSKFSSMREKNAVLFLAKIFDGAKQVPHLQYFIGNGFWMTLKEGATTLLGVFVSVALARLLTKETYGQYQLVITIISLFSVFSIPGLNSSLTRSVARGYDGNYRNSVHISFWWSLIAVPLLSSLAGYFYIIGNQDVAASFLISAIFFPFFYAPNTWNAFLVGKQKFNLLTRWNIISVLFQSFLLVTMAWIFKNNLIVLVFSYFFSYTIFNYIWYKKSFALIQTDKKNEEDIDYGFFLTKLSTLEIVASYIDKVLVGLLLGPESLAIYTIVSLIAVKIKDLSKVVGQLIFPKFSTSKKTFVDILYAYQRPWLLFTLSMVAISGLYYVSIPTLIRLLFSEQYTPYTYLAQWFTITVVLSFPLAVLAYYVLAKKEKKIIILSRPIFAFIRIVLNAFAIYFFGLIGAVVAFNLSMLIRLFFFLFGIKYTQPKKGKDECLRI